MSERWATFDCYGTLVDWNAGIRTELERLLGPGDGDRWAQRYHEIEPRVQRDDPTLGYRQVMAAVLEQLAEDAGVDLGEPESDALARSLPRWPIFPEVPEALREASRGGWRLAILSNTDRDLIDASMRAIDAPFEFAIVASEIGSYKPMHGHWQAFYERTGADRGAHVHVGASLYHDLEPARELGIASVWINRAGEAASVAVGRELPDLTGLRAALDELRPA
jgi:2-haloacid dehalogenase